MLVVQQRLVTNWPVCASSTSETETSLVAWERKHQPNPERVTLNQSPTKTESGKETASWARANCGLFRARGKAKMQSAVFKNDQEFPDGDDRALDQAQALLRAGSCVTARVPCLSAVPQPPAIILENIRKGNDHPGALERTGRPWICTQPVM